jgi:hypothetical protein
MHLAYTFPFHTYQQLLELRLVIAHLTLAFFFAPIEDRFNSQETYEVLATHPKQTFIKADRW